MIIQGSPEILRGPRGLNGFGDFGSLSDYTSVEELYQFIIGRQVSSDPSSPFYDAGVQYFQDRFGSEISSDEVDIFEQMAASEVAARVAYFDDLERLRGEARIAGQLITLRQQLDADGLQAAIEAANKQAIADALTAVQNKSLEVAAAAEKARAEAAAAKQVIDLYEAKAAGVVARAQAEAAAAEAARNKAIADDPICGPGYAWDGQMCRATGASPFPAYGAGGDEFGVGEYEKQVNAENAAREIYVKATQAAIRAQQASIEQASSTPAVPKDIALRLAYQSSTGGGSTALFDSYGGYETVMQAAAQYGYSPTPAWIQNYELSNGLPESAYTKLNKQFVGPTGEDKFQQLQEDLLSKNKAIAEQARADVAAQTAAAEAAFAKQQQATIDKIIAERKVLAAEADAAFARQEAANKKTIADAYAAAQAASKAAVEASTLAAKQAADALRARALIAVKALYLQVLGREGDTEGLDYFADRFGDVIDPDELQIFSDMSKPEIDARNAYLADMAKKSKEDAAKAKAIADQFAATAANAKKTANQDTRADETGYRPKNGGINPALILAAAAAAFFIGG